MMKNKIITAFLTVSIVTILIGCGTSVQSESSPNTTNGIELNLESKNDDMAERDVKKDIEEAYEETVIDTNDGTKEVLYVDGFDVYRDYEPSDRILNTSLSDGMYIQIGDAVLQLGYATLTDFVNAGVDLYSTKIYGDEDNGAASRLKEKNDKYLQEKVSSYQNGKVMLEGYISSDYKIEMILSEDTVLTENNPSDPIVESIKIEPYGGSIGNPNDFLYGEQSYQDINAIYINGGIKYTGRVSDIPSFIGDIELDESKEGTDGHQGWTKVFTADSPNPSYQYYCQVLSRDDHIFSIFMYLKKK